VKFYAEIEYRFPEPETDKDRRECDEAEILVRNAIANLLTQNLLVGNRAMSVVVCSERDKRFNEWLEEECGYPLVVPS